MTRLENIGASLAVGHLLLWSIPIVLYTGIMFVQWGLPELGYDAAETARLIEFIAIMVSILTYGEIK